MHDVKTLFFIFMITQMTACTPGGNDPTQVVLSDLVGLWNSSEKSGAKTDLIYTRVSSGGAIIEYDFDGDEVDGGLNCYQIDTGSLTNISENRFQVATDMHAGKKFLVELELLDAGNALKVYFLDENDPQRTLESQIWTRVADESILDNEPSCQQR